MDMYCFQCQETSNNTGCTTVGVCGKTDDVAALQDLLVYALKGMAIYGQKARELQLSIADEALFAAKSLFSTITNVNFDNDFFYDRIATAFSLRDQLRSKIRATLRANEWAQDSLLPEMATYFSAKREELLQKAYQVGVLTTENEDVRSLRELLIYGLKGIAAYAEHADVFQTHDEEIFAFIFESLAATTNANLSVDDLVGLVLKAGETSIKAMEILDRANTTAFGNPEPTKVNIGVGQRPGILISGHDLKDLEDLLKQTENSGIDVYTHGEMLPANSYPAFKKYKHFVGNYGNAWHDQLSEFEAFNGPVLLTTNCLVPPRDSYKERVYTTGMVGFPGVTHIADRTLNGQKDFSPLIEQAKTCKAPTSLEEGSIIGGYARHTVLSVADQVIEAVQTGAISKFVVMAGCDGRHRARQYYTNLAKALPSDAVILTAGCAKYRYNKLNLGEIGGIPRVLDAGQCNDSYSLIMIAKALASAFEVEDINQLPIAYDIAWYEQKAVAVLLALLYLGVKGIRLGPTLPAFLSPNVIKVLVEKFDIKPMTTVEEDLAAIMAS